MQCFSVVCIYLSFFAEFHDDDVDNVQCCELVVLRDIVLFKSYYYVHGGVRCQGRKMGNSR